MLSFHFVNGKIRVLESSYQKKNIKIEKSFVVEIPEGEWWGRGEIEKIYNILREELERNNIKEKDLHVTLEAREFFLRIMEFPYIPLKELRDNIIDELEEFSSFREENMDLDYSLLSSDKERIRVLVVAIPKVITNSLKNLSERLKLNLKYIEITSLSTLRGLILENHDFSKNQAIIFLGNEVTDVYLFQKGNLFSLYNLSIGIQDLLLSESLSINTTLLSFVDEIKTYISTSPFDLEELVIVGEDEKSIPLLNYLQESFSEIPVRVYKNLWLPNIGVSLGLQKFPSIPNLNLLGKEKVPFQIEKDILVRSLLAGFLALLIVFSGNIYITLQLRSIERERIFLEQNLNQRRAEVEELRRTIEERISLNKGLENWIKELDENKSISPGYFLKDLSNIIPVKVWLSDLEVAEDNKMLFQGCSLDSEGVADFLISLSYSKIFKDVNLQSSSLTNIGNKTVQSFRIVGVIK